MAGVSRGPLTFVDTSVFVAGLLEIGEHYGEAQAALGDVVGKRARKPITAWHCCLEFYSVATRLPEGYRLAPADALRIIDEVIVTGFEIVDLPPPRRGDLLREAVAEGVRGGRLYDAHLGAIAHAHGAEVVITENPRHFAALLRHGIRVVTARDYRRLAGSR